MDHLEHLLLRLDALPLAGGEEEVTLGEGRRGDVEAAAGATSVAEGTLRLTGATTVDTVTGMRASPDPRLFIGRGKAEEVLAAAKAL